MAECSARNAVLLEGSFAIFPKTTVKYHVLITNSEISYVNHQSDLLSVNHQSPKKSSNHAIKFSDVIGVDCMRGQAADCPNAYLNIYAYLHHKKFACSNSSVRRRQCVTFVFSRFSSFEENYKDALQWQLVMTYLIRGVKVEPEGTLTAQRIYGVYWCLFLSTAEAIVHFEASTIRTLLNF